MQIHRFTGVMLVVGLFATAAPAATTYFFDYSLPIGGGEGLGTEGTISLSGFITVDNLGPVENGDVSDWSASFSSTTYPGPTVLTPSNSFLDITGAALSATATELVFQLEDQEINAPKSDFRIRGDVPDINNFVGFSLATGEEEPNQFFAEHTPGFAAPFEDPRDISSVNPGGPGPFVFAVIPEPGSLTLLALGGLTLLRRR